MVFEPEIVLQKPDGSNTTMSKLADELGVSRQRVHRKYQIALEKGVEPLEYIITKHKRENKNAEEYKRYFDGQVHSLEFEDSVHAEAFCLAIKAFHSRANPYGTGKTRRLDNVVLLKFTT